MQWPSEHILIDRIKPSDISGCHGPLDIRSKKRTLTQERLFAARLQEIRSATAQSPIRYRQANSSVCVMKSQKTTKDSSGSVRIQGNKIFWEHNGKLITEIDIGNIVVIGEYTNSDGPYSDDWFISFVTKDGKWQSIPWYIENRDTLLNYLCTNFQNDFNISLLVGSFEWASVIRYPEHLKGESLFKLIPTEKYKEPKSFFDRVLNSIGLGGFDTNQYVELTDSVKNELTNSSR